MNIKFNDFINENYDLPPRAIVSKDMECLKLSEPIVINKAKKMLVKLIMDNKEKYDNIIEIINIQNEVDKLDGKSERSKFTNLEYLYYKSDYKVSEIKNKWNKIKQDKYEEIS